MLELGTLELQIPMGDIVSPNADEAIAAWIRASIHTKKRHISG